MLAIVEALRHLFIVERAAALGLPDGDRLRWRRRGPAGLDPVRAPLHRRKADLRDPERLAGF